MSPIIDRLEKLFQERGQSQYGGEAVSQLEHALQSAAYAKQHGGSAADIVAALLHDVGHLLHGHGEDCAEQGIDDHHEALGFRFLAKYFPPSVVEPIHLHVPAKRYLVSVEPSYGSTLSEPSLLSLRLQGGPMSPAEVASFEQDPHYQAAVRLRHADDAAKVPGLPTPTFHDFRAELEAVVVTP